VDALTRTTMPTELIGAAVDALPDVASALRAGGSVLDVGCGYGAPTLGWSIAFCCDRSPARPDDPTRALIE